MKIEGQGVGIGEERVKGFFYCAPLEFVRRTPRFDRMSRFLRAPSLQEFARRSRFM